MCTVAQTTRATASTTCYHERLPSGRLEGIHRGSIQRTFEVDDERRTADGVHHHHHLLLRPVGLVLAAHTHSSLSLSLSRRLGVSSLPLSFSLPSTPRVHSSATCDFSLPHDHTHTPTRSHTLQHDHTTPTRSHTHTHTLPHDHTITHTHSNTTTHTPTRGRVEPAGAPI